MAFYEKHEQDSPKFPFKFQHHCIKEKNAFPLHWHESVEILCVRSGTLRVQYDGKFCQIKDGDTFVVNSSQLHSGQVINDVCDYFCLIINLHACEWLGIPVKEIIFNSPIREDWILTELIECERLLDQISQHPYLYTEVRLRLMMLFTKLAQQHSDTLDSGKMVLQQKRSQFGRQIISYIDEHFREPLTTGTICSALGFSKSYICHSFRASTGMTVTDYLLYRRCSYAQKLLKAGLCNVSEAAIECGFSNFSYFSRAYRKCMGVLPSADARLAIS